ncbi:unnamed protein product [Linum trigynum]|uniref:Spen paralogue and orthologue SPOC C-terminal domain-containing protein n=1 Tax=Linum trigynum TaxID=586398 RepID=A0AAV2D0Q3_9ROSI
MGSAEQPLKKRRLYEFQPEEPPPPPDSSAVPQPPSTSVAPPGTPPPLSQEEILARRRNRDEIRSVYDTYKRLKFFLAQKDGIHSLELEQAYLSLIAASRGCSSVQRIVADLIPRYALNFPTALQSATKAVIDMHNWSVAIIERGEDKDDIPFETAKSCIFGLADICHVATSDASISYDIRRIVFVAFRNALSFFFSSDGGTDILKIIDNDFLKIQDSAELFFELKEKFCHEDQPSLSKLSKLRALSFIWIFFSWPKNIVTACFELLSSNAMEEIKEGKDCVILLTSQLNTNNATDSSIVLTSGSTRPSDEKGVSGGGSFLPVNSLLHLVLQKHVSLRSWMFLKCKKFFNRPSLGDASATRTSFEQVFESFPELRNLEGSQMDNDEDDSDPSDLLNQQYLAHRKSSDQDIYGEPRSADGRNQVSGSLRSMDWETSDPGGPSHGRSSVPSDVMNQHKNSPVTRGPVDFRSNSFEARRHNHSAENPVSAGGLINTSNSPKDNLGALHGGQCIWFCDGDPIAMEVFAASRQLWVGFLSPDASEVHLRFELDRFGPMEQFFFFPVQGFALAEYRSTIDAVRAREYMRSHFPWLIKFMDVGLGTRGSVNGAAIGSSRYVYAGNISSQWVRDEVLHESQKVIYRGPYMVTDLYSEGALLMEFESPEEATAVMVHLRQYRKEKILPPSDALTSNAGMPHLDGARSMPSSADAADLKANPIGNIGNSTNESGQAQAVLESPAAMNLENNGTAAVQVGYPFGSSNPPHAGSHVSAEQLWMYNNNEPQFQPASYVQPAYQPPNSSWDPQVPPPLAAIPSHAEIPPPLPLAPPPPSSPPPPPPLAESADPGISGHSWKYGWQGALCKSGVHYCTINVIGVDSELCKYSNGLSEPAEWPSRLDMTKRTDFRHVKSTFSSTPTHKREVCQLIPASSTDKKGYQDFISYLKQRECAGVIKIPPSKPMWGRLLFILPYSQEVCSMLSIAFDASSSHCGLIGLILPKETNYEWL